MADENIERWSPLKAWMYSLLHKKPKSNLAIVDRLDLGPDDSFLDVGCGPGAALERASLTGATVAGVDPSEAMVKRAGARVPGAEVKVGSAENLPFDDNRFTAAVNVSSFHHWADREAGLREMLRVLASGGQIHVVEGKLRDGKDGHGLSSREAGLIGEKLVEIGFIDPKIEELKTGWFHNYLVVSAEKPRS